MRVLLKSVPNLDYDEVFPPSPEQWATTRSLKDASKVCLEYIEKYNLGGGNWAGGDVFLRNKKIARVSYNGRIWTIRNHS